jgi:hypothetical protein
MDAPTKSIARLHASRTLPITNQSVRSGTLECASVSVGAIGVPSSFVEFKTGIDEGVKTLIDANSPKVVQVHSDSSKVNKYGRFGQRPEASELSKRKRTEAIRNHQHHLFRIEAESTEIFV